MSNASDSRANNFTIKSNRPLIPGKCLTNSMPRHLVSSLYKEKYLGYPRLRDRHKPSWHWHWFKIIAFLNESLHSRVTEKSSAALIRFARNSDLNDRYPRRREIIILTINGRILSNHCRGNTRLEKERLCSVTGLAIITNRNSSIKLSSGCFRRW